ncbi:hypothetical protein AAG906_040189 [Vitis piasezkii]
MWVQEHMLIEANNALRRKDALEVATDPDYRFDLAIQLGRLGTAKVRIFIYL